MPYRFITSLIFHGTAALVAGAGAGEYEESLRPLLDRYCYECHGKGKRIKGDVNLAEFKEVTSVHRDPKTWELVLRQLREREMPPEKKPQPGEQEREALINGIQNLLDNPDENAIPHDPGRVVLHRLSRNPTPPSPISIAAFSSGWALEPCDQT